MAYLRISDDAMDHPKLSGLSDGAFRFWINANCWCQKHLTDGRIPKASLRDIPRFKPTHVRDLVTAGLWRSDHDVYLVHDFLAHNDSKQQVAERRKRKAERMEAWRERRRSHLVGTPQDAPVDRPHDGPRAAPEPSPSTSPHLSGSKEPPHAGETADAKDALAERAARFLDRYVELYARHRYGSFYRVVPARDFHYAEQLVRDYPDDAWLDRLAAIYLLREDRDVSGKSRTVGQFASSAAWCDSELRREGKSPQPAGSAA